MYTCMYPVVIMLVWTYQR